MAQLFPLAGFCAIVRHFSRHSVICSGVSFSFAQRVIVSMNGISISGCRTNFFFQRHHQMRYASISSLWFIHASQLTSRRTQPLLAASVESVMFWSAILFGAGCVSSFVRPLEIVWREPPEFCSREVWQEHSHKSGTPIPVALPFSHDSSGLAVPRSSVRGYLFTSHEVARPAV